MCTYFSLSLLSITIATAVTNAELFRYLLFVITFKTWLYNDLYTPRMYANQRVSLKLLPPLTTYYVKLCLRAYNKEKMVSYMNSELCNTLGNLRNRCKSILFLNICQMIFVQDSWYFCCCCVLMTEWYYLPGDENNVYFYLVTLPDPELENSLDWYPH